MAYQGIDRAPLLPASLRGRLGGCLRRAAGAALFIAAAALSLALLTWSAADPSFSHVTNASTRNLIGPAGAILADLLMQLLGLAGILVVLPPLMWAASLARGEPLARWRSKIALAPLGMVAIAGALSALPITAGWPLHHGNGGVIGDVAFTVLTSAFLPINADKAAPLAGLLLLAGGGVALKASLGFSPQQWREILSTPGLNAIAAVARRAARALVPARLKLPTRRPRRAGSRAPPARREPPMYRGDGMRGGLPRIVPALDRMAPAVGDAMPTVTRGEAFEDSIDPSSRAIAQRFAPAGKLADLDLGAAKAPAALNAAPAALSAAPTAPLAEPAFCAGPVGYRRPSVTLLKRPPAAKAGEQLTQSALMGHAHLLSDVLADFGVKGDIKGINPGPVVTLFEFEPARGTKSQRVIALADDIARSMSAVSVRVAVVPGRNVIGIELPNPRRDTVYLRELVEAEAFRLSPACLPLALGKSIAGGPVIADLARMPHLLVAGTTGAGKSVGINAMILSLLYRLSPQDCRLLMIDPKMLELSVYNGIPHLLCPVVTDADKAVAALNWVVREMEDRYARMAKLGVRSIEAFNARARQAAGRAGGEEHGTPLPYIVVVVDEFADLMLVAGKEIEAAVQRLAQMARAAGIHLIMATQRPSVDVITGTIKANFPTRISFKVASKFDSRTILNDQGAEQLLGQGDMLLSGGNDRLTRVHGALVSDDEVEGIAARLRAEGAPAYVGGITDPIAPEAAAPANATQRAEELYDRAVGIVMRDGKPSTSYLQRRLAIGYNRAASLIERMEREQVIGPVGDGGRRQILLGPPTSVRAAW